MQIVQTKAKRLVEAAQANSIYKHYTYFCQQNEPLQVHKSLI